MKYYGAIGFSETDKTGVDIWEPKIVERQYAGDINRVSTGWKTSEHLNDDLTVSMELSIVLDIYAMEHYSGIRYAVWRGTKWKVTNISEAFPRITLTLGGEYNDNDGSAAETE